MGTLGKKPCKIAKLGEPHRKVCPYRLASRRRAQSRSSTINMQGIVLKC